jgi:two-component system, NtrC family, sensor kinase
MFLEALISFLLLLQVRRILQKNALHPQWQKYCLWGMVAIGILFVLQETFSTEDVSMWVWHIILLGIIGFIMLRQEFQSLRGIVFSFLPLIIISVFKDVFGFSKSDWAATLVHYLDLVTPLAIIWLVVMLVIFNKQRRALEKERKIRLTEEEENKVIAARKAELEEMVKERTAELTKQKEELEGTLRELRATQDQLIQSEKMASLGELTAGIAHEIQNPLNFVNNFSELNAELIDEMKQALMTGNASEAIHLADSIRENEDKIKFHGKRADAIVKGMLQHSRSSSGVKEPTDINELADEYLRLAYHGLRAKDKSFNATMKTSFDESIGMINVIPQDIGRVVLNLITNAFYAVTEKKKTDAADYEPTVTVTTSKVPASGNGGNLAEIRVKDNGNGIPQRVLDKIFQPFFTTKPTGQGTGLGLSLSYDIVTKGHGGELKVETKEGEYAEFIIQLPV